METYLKEKDLIEFGLACIERGYYAITKHISIDVEGSVRFQQTYYDESYESEVEGTRVFLCECHTVEKLRMLYSLFNDDANIDDHKAS